MKNPIKVLEQQNRNLATRLESYSRAYADLSRENDYLLGQLDVYHNFYSKLRSRLYKISSMKNKDTAFKKLFEQVKGFIDWSKDKK